MKKFLQTPNTFSKKFLCIFFLFLLLLAAMTLSLGVGPLKLTVWELFTTLRTGTPAMPFHIVWDVRIPRILLGVLTGAALAVSGALLQSVLRNPLAAPGIIGVSSGAGLAGVLVMLAYPAWSALLVPAAFSGALGAALLVYLLAWKEGISPVRLILAGVALSTMLGALTSAIMLFYAERAGGIFDFLVGSLSSKGWAQIQYIRFYIPCALAGGCLLARKLNVLALGDEMATSLGLNVERIRFSAVAIAALLAASAVSTVGLLGFVGLIAPHIVRILLGSDHRFLLPGAALFGAFLVVTADAIGRVAWDPVELPVGLLMAMLGAPFFLWLLRRNSYES